VSTYAQRLQERRTRFVQRWLVRLQLTSERLNDLRSVSGKRDSLVQINRDFHQLAGAAGIYELQELCSLAIAAEDLCGNYLLRVLRAQNDLDGDSLQRLEELLERIQQLLHELNEPAAD
jgi:HPt (histidine-containing phosphotransfer) domain-containing protein